jgi:hypothetical protein
MFRKLQRLAVALFMAFGVAGAMTVSTSVAISTPADAGVLSSIKGAAKAVGSGIKTGAKAVGGAVAGGFKAGAGAVKTAGIGIGRGVAAGAKGAYHGLEKAGVIRTFTQAGKGAVQIGQKVGKYLLHR